MADVEANEKHDGSIATTLHNGREPSPVNIAAQRGSIASTKEQRKVLEHSHDADEAMKAFESGEVIEIDEATNKRLLRIIDRHMMPIMCVVYGLNYLDKVSLHV